MRVASLALAALLSGCVIQVPAPTSAPPPPDPETYSPAVDSAPADAPPAQDDGDDSAVSVYVEPPLAQPAPIAVGWAPPPMLVEAPPPSPFPAAVWVGGYWVWQGNWVWAHGHWVAPPGVDYGWVHPYYEHRGDEVIFIDGHWARHGVAFVPPPPGMLVVERPAFGVRPGPRPLGPDGCFVPAPPGSRAGIIIPAPVGTAPAVVTSAPAVVNVGMRITNNVTNVTRVTNVTNITNVTIVAPPGATANGRAFNTAVPAAPHLAASRPALVQARAPEPVSAHPVPAYTPGSRPPVLPRPQPVMNPGGHMPPAFNREAAPQPGPAANHPQGPYAREPQPVRAGPGSAEPASNGAHNQAPYAPAPQLARDVPPGHQPANVRGVPPGQVAQQPTRDPGQGHASPNVRDVPPGHAPQPGVVPPPSHASAPALAGPPPAVAHSAPAPAVLPPRAPPANNAPAPAHADGDKGHKSEGQPQKHDKQKEQGEH